MTIDLPYTLNVDGIERKINCDFRDVILILNAFNDDELNASEKTKIMLTNLYVDDWWNFEDIDGAIKSAMWFIDWGKKHAENTKSPKLMDWEQDFNLIISAVDKSVKTAESCLELPFMHWWTFLTKFSERGECQFSTILDLRNKISKGKKLEPYEKTLLKENRDQIILKNKTNDDFEKDLWR